MINCTGCSLTERLSGVLWSDRRTGVRGQPTCSLKTQKPLFFFSALFSGKELFVCVFVRSQAPFYYKIQRAALSTGLVEEIWYSPSHLGHPTIRDVCRLLSPYCLDCGWAFHHAGTAQGNGCHGQTWPEILTSSTLALLCLPGSMCVELFIRNSPHHVR